MLLVYGKRTARGRQDQVCRVAVAVVRRPSSVQVRGDRHGEFIDLAHHYLPAAAALDGGTGEDAFVAPHFGLEARQYFLLTHLLSHLVVVCFRVRARRLQHRWDRQRYLEWLWQLRLAGQQRSGRAVAGLGACGRAEREGEHHTASEPEL